MIPQYDDKRVKNKNNEMIQVASMVAHLKHETFDNVYTHVYSYIFIDGICVFIYFFVCIASNVLTYIYSHSNSLCQY